MPLLNTPELEGWADAPLKHPPHVTNPDKKRQKEVKHLLDTPKRECFLQAQAREGLRPSTTPCKHIWRLRLSLALF